jgi:hypothetical protein
LEGSPFCHLRVSKLNLEFGCFRFQDGMSKCCMTAILSGTAMVKREQQKTGNSGRTLVAVWICNFELDLQQRPCSVVVAREPPTLVRKLKVDGSIPSSVVFFCFA